jgi:hypothetical protein
MQMTTQKLVVDSEGLVSLNGLHDSEILGLVMDRRSSVLRIQLVTEAGRNFEFVLSGVRSLSANRFRVQNVVFRVFALSKVDVERELIREAEQLDILEVKEWSEKVKSGELTLFQVDASVGCELSCLCERVEVVI